MFVYQVHGGIRGYQGAREKSEERQPGAGTAADEQAQQRSWQTGTIYLYFIFI